MKKIVALLSFLALTLAPVSYAFFDDISDKVDTAKDYAEQHEEDVVALVNKLDAEGLEKVGLDADVAKKLGDKEFSDYDDMFDFLSDNFKSESKSILAKLQGAL